MGLYDNITYAEDEVSSEDLAEPTGAENVVEDEHHKKGVLKKLAVHKS